MIIVTGELPVFLGGDVPGLASALLKADLSRDELGNVRAWVNGSWKVRDYWLLGWLEKR